MARSAGTNASCASPAPKAAPDSLLEIVFVEDLRRPPKRAPRPAKARKSNPKRLAAGKKQLARPRKAGSGERGRGKKAIR